ncbi:MAG: hypothetical protein ACYDHH_23125 [Solirubrobacteraceae bacterium]
MIPASQSAGMVSVVGGSLSGGARVPWAAFSQALGDGSQQIFVRSFNGTAWQTQGFPQSLNEDLGAVAQAPSIDFTGANRTVPWVAWEEPSTKFAGVEEIFASRFAPQPAPAQNGGQWIHEGQQVTATAPSLNINTNRKATDPALFGGTTTAGGNPAPWITWQEADNGNTVAPSPAAGGSHFQIFVSHAVPATSGACPAGTKPAHGNSVGNFCFQQVGIDRVANPALKPNTDPSLNVDPSRDGIQADIAFTGPNDTVPWVVWYENSDHGSSGLLNDADMVFAARAIADATGDGGFHWQVVGLGTAGQGTAGGVLGTAASTCVASKTAEQACSLDAAAAAGLIDGNGAENPTVAAGTMVAGKNTTPWVAWDESSSNGGAHSVFVARLDAAGDHFDLLNNGQSISNSGFNSTRPQISFSGNTPYVSWREANGTQTLTFVGHFEGNPANPVFHIDTPTGIASTPIVTSDDDITDIRSPVASACPADPFTSDGSSCPGAAVGTPFYAFTTLGGSTRSLFADTYQPENVTTTGATGVSGTGATLNGSVNPAGAPVNVQFQFGPTVSYGSTTAVQPIGPGETQATFASGVTGPAGTLHYRAVAVTDFGSFPGSDQTVTIPSAGPTGPTGTTGPTPTVSSRITSPHGKVKAKKLKQITGTATATLGVAHVSVAVVEISGGARVAKHRRSKPSCKQLGADGQLHKLAAGAHGLCTPTQFLTAKGTTSWTLNLPHKLPKGSYVAVSRATDTAGHVEKVGSADRASFKVT